MDDRQLIEDLLSALEYHTEQTRPIEFSKVAIEAAREYLRKPVQQWSAGVPPLYPKPEPGVSIKAEYEPAQSMHPEIKKMYEDYFDKCYRESSSAVPENFIDALRFDVAVRDALEWEKVDMREHAEGNLGIGTAPPPSQRNPLSDEEALEIARTFGAQPWPPGSCVAFARAIEAAHGIKE